MVYLQPRGIIGYYYVTILIYSNMQTGNTISIFKTLHSQGVKNPYLPLKSDKKKFDPIQSLFCSIHAILYAIYELLPLYELPLKRH